MKYLHLNIEKKWQENWNLEKIYEANIKGAKKPFYNLFMFPYPSAEGLHAGHAFSSTGGDVYGRFMRMSGYEVFQPMGYDSFGIHSENYAIKVGQTPQEMLSRTTKHYEMQLRSLGHGYDWSKTLTTSDPGYYKWTQWLFIVLFKKGLAYKKKANVNWCPSCKTVLADEQVIEGKCERCGTLVEKKSLTQWFVKITDYADRLLDNLSKIDWTEKVKVAQKNWIGKAEGLTISFGKVNVWTKYWETIFGATFIVVSPEYLLENYKEETSKESLQYAKLAVQRSTEERQINREKTGADTGLFALNKATNKKIPVWVADYVLEGVGTGAVMGVPCHDKRDFEFAKKFGLPLAQVVSYIKKDLNEKIKNYQEACEEPGILTNSEEFNGLSSSKEGKEKIKLWLIQKGFADLQTNYHLRDWLISRQRYWGAPIPMIFCKACAKNKEGELKNSEWDSSGWYTVPENNLPVLLPEINDYKPEGDGSGPLAKHPEFYIANCPHCGLEAKRETDVLDTFMDSSWYYLRYPSVNSDTSNSFAFDKEITKKWLPVNFYLGGAEHSVLHLMYARFINQVLFDLKYIDFEEPFPRFYAHGLMIKDGSKMSKSKGNVVNPDSYIEKFGADAMRLYFMFIGPMDGSPDFRDTGIEGMERFVNRVWELLLIKGRDNGKELDSVMHQTIKKVTEELKNFRFNTAIAKIMEYTNAIKLNKTKITKENLQALCLLLAPFAPHLTEEIWMAKWDNKTSIHKSMWPIYDNTKIVAGNIVVAVQINGKTRGEVEILNENINNEEKVKNLALENKNIKKWIEGKEILKTIYIPEKILNFVTNK